VWSPDFKLQYHHQKNKQTKKGAKTIEIKKGVNTYALVKAYILVKAKYFAYVHDTKFLD
jgi:hypothetical protein